VIKKGLYLLIQSFCSVFVHFFQSYDQDGDKQQLQNYAGNCPGHGAGHEGLKAEVAAHAHEHGDAPDAAAHKHGEYQRGIDRAAALGHYPVDKAGHKAVACQLKGHAQSGGEHGGHAEDDGAEKGSHEAHRKTPGRAAEEAAEQHGNVHGQKHGAYLGYLPGDKGQHQRQRKEHGGENEISEIAFLFHNLSFPKEKRRTKACRTW